MELRHSQTSRRIFFSSLLCGAVFACMLTATHFFLVKRDETRQVEARLEAVGTFASQAIAAEILQTDQPHWESLLHRIVSPQMDIGFCEIKGRARGRDFDVKLGDPNNSGMPAKSFPFKHRGQTGEEVAGMLILGSDPGTLGQAVSQRNLQYFLGMILFTGVFSVGCFFLVRNILTRHLLEVVRHTDHLKLDESDRPLVLAGKKTGARPDDMDLLVGALNTMHRRLVGNLATRKETEALRTRERALLTALIDSIPDLIFYKDIGGIYLGCNTAFEEFAGRGRHEIVGMTDLDIFPREVAEFFRSQDQEMFAKGGPRSNEEWVRYPDGKMVLFDTLKTVYRDESGEILGLIGISRDITARNAVENDLKTARERFEKAFNISPMMIMILDAAKERLIDVNLPCLRKTGYRKEEIIGKTIDDLGFWPGDVYPDQQRFLESFSSDGIVKEFPVRLRAKTGNSLSCLVSGRTVSFSGQECLLLFLEDLSRREKAEQALQLSECRFRDFANAAADWFWETDADLRFTYLIGKVEEVMGVEIDEIVGHTWDQLYLGSGNKVESIERKMNRDKLAGREPFTGFEVDWLRPDGKRRWIVLNGKPVSDPQGRFFGYRGAGRDISVQKEAQEAMRRSMKMDAVGQVTGGIAHDFNNILGIIIGNLDFIKRFGNPDDLILKRIEAAAKASERAGKLTRQLLDFSRRQARDCQPTDINKIIQEMDSLIARSVTPEVEVVTDLAPDLWMTDIDHGDFEDVMLNLVINARDAMPKGGRLQISTGNIVLDDYCTFMNPVLEKGEYVMLTVKDAGVGIPPGVIEHIFEPFYTTKPQGKGTGLGLSMVYAFTQRSKGSVRVYSEPDVGTTVRMYLPRTKEKIREKRGLPEITPGLPGGSETILIVDDEADLLALTAEMLEILGYTTITAGNGNEAMALLMEKTNDIDLLFTDVVMPGGMNGFELAEQALLLKPELKVLFSSGYIEKAVPKSGQFAFTPQILFKPYNELDLATRIGEILHG